MADPSSNQRSLVTSCFLSEVIAQKPLSKMPLPTASGGISRERFKLGSRSFWRLSGTIGLTNMLDVTSLAASGLLQNAVNYCTKVCTTGLACHKSLVIRPLSRLESQSFTRISMPTYSIAISDAKTGATSCLQLSRLRKRPKMSPPMALGRILVARRFVWPN